MRLFVSRRMGPFRVGASFGPRDFRRGGYRQSSPHLGSDYVYVIQGRDAVKVGVTSDLDGRLATLQTGSPHPLALAYSTRVAGDAYAVEAEAHAMLDRHRLAGEWFAVPADVAVAAINGAAFRLGGTAQDGFKPPKPRWGRRFWLAVLWSTPFWPMALSPLGPISLGYLLLVWIAAAFRTNLRYRLGLLGTLVWVSVGLSGFAVSAIPGLAIAAALGLFHSGRP